MKSILGDKTPQSMRIAVYIIIFTLSVFLFASVYDLLMFNSGNMEGSKVAIGWRVAFTLACAMVYMGLGTFDIGFFFAAIFVLLIGFTDISPELSKGGRVIVTVSGLGMVLATSLYFAKTGGQLLPTSWGTPTVASAPFFYNGRYN